MGNFHGHTLFQLAFSNDILMVKIHLTHKTIHHILPGEK